MKRRTFIIKTGLSAGGLGLISKNGLFDQSIKSCKIQKLSPSGKNHFFGYYGINTWDKSKRYHLSLETDFDDRVPSFSDVAKVGLIDSKSNRFISFAETAAFNFQQGSMMHWIDAGFGEEFIYNAFEEKSLISFTVNPISGKKRKIKAPVAALSPNGRDAIGLNYIRMWYCRKEVGYIADIENYETKNIPEDDGLFTVNLNTGEKQLFLPFTEIVKHPDFNIPVNGLLWFNHVLFNPSGSRMLFFCRVKTEKSWETSLWTINSNGTELQCQIPFGHWVSHFDWKDDNIILFTSDILGSRNFIEFTDGKKNFHVVGKEILTRDGHCSYSPDRQWILSDAQIGGRDNPQAEIFLFNTKTNEKTQLGIFNQDIKRANVIRCDLHPRFSSDGKTITFDSVHEGERQIYMINI
jgi:hypothetical protein